MSYAQEPWDWSTPAPITDSVSNNCNPFLTNAWFLEDVLLVWEKSTDTASTAIYMKLIKSSGDEFPVLSDSGVHYTNPVIMHVNYNQIRFMLFYESDQNGVKNINYLIYDYDGNFSVPQAFFHTPHDDISIDVGSKYYNAMVWTSNGALQYSKYNIIEGAFIEPETISTGLCANPKIILENLVYWEMKYDTSFQIFRSQRVMNEWTEPVMITGYSDVRNLSRSHIEYGIASDVVIWSALSGSYWKMIVSYTGWSSVELSPQSNEPFDPAIAPPVLGVKEYVNNPFYVAFPAEEEGFMEIFVNAEPFGDFFNLSVSGTDNRNPVMFLIESYDNPAGHGFYIYLFWESDRNGHWQLYFSRLFMLVGNVNERIPECSMLNIIPNPSADRATLSYWLDEPAEVQIVLTDFTGKTVATIREGYKNQGLQSTEINMNNLKISPGIYVICLITDDQRICTKLVKTK